MTGANRNAVRTTVSNMGASLRVVPCLLRSDIARAPALWRSTYRETGIDSGIRLEMCSKQENTLKNSIYQSAAAGYSRRFRRRVRFHTSFASKDAGAPEEAGRLAGASLPKSFERKGNRAYD